VCNNRRKIMSEKSMNVKEVLKENEEKNEKKLSFILTALTGSNDWNNYSYRLFVEQVSKKW